MIESGSHVGPSAPAPHSSSVNAPAGAAGSPGASNSSSTTGANVGEARFVGPGVLAELLAEADAEAWAS